MKTNLLCSAVLSLLLVGSLKAHAQAVIDWQTIDGGGGASSNGLYTVTGTIGQPDAGLLTGGNVTLQGGFWGVVVPLQTPGAPWLTITRTNGNVIVSWPTPATGFVLEQTPTLATPIHWSGISTDLYQTNGSNLTFTIAPPIGNQSYRLRKP